MSSDRKAAAVSIAVDLYDRSKARAKSLGFTTWSAYVVQLIRADLQKGGNIAVHEEVAEHMVVGKAESAQRAHSPPVVRSHARS